MSQDLTIEEHRDIATECVQKLHKGRNWLHFAAGEAEKLGEHMLAAKIDGLKDDIEELIEDNFEEAPDFKHDLTESNHE